MKAIITKGLPASGKSTWVRKFCEQNGYVRFNNDEVRFARMDELGVSEWNRKIESYVNQKRLEFFQESAKEGKNVVVDNTHLNPKTFERTKKQLEDLGYIVEVKSFLDVTLDVCLERDSLRTGREHVGSKVIMDMYNKYLKKNAGKVPTIDMDSTLPMCVICDIDGTLADATSRDIYDVSKVYEDEVIWHVDLVLKCIMGMSARAGLPVNIFFFSGRNDSCRNETVMWLMNKCEWDVDGNENIELHMRKNGDTRRDSIVKREMYDEHIAGKYNVIAVFDDRAQVVRECWKPLGVPMFRCGVIDEDEF